MEHFSEAFIAVTLGREGTPRAGWGQPFHRNGGGKVWGSGPNTTQLATKRLAGEGLSLEEISEARGLSLGTILGHLEKLALAGEELEPFHLMPSAAKREKIEAAFKQSGQLLLSPVKEILGEEYSYEEIKLVLIGLRQAGPAGTAAEC